MMCSSIVFFFFKQKTAYEMRISDWSSDVCSSDLALDAVTRELDETLPHALGRITAHGQTTQTALSQLRPLLDASELVAQSTVSHVNAVQATLKANEEQMAGQAASQQELADRINGALADAENALAMLREGADEVAEQGGAGRARKS